MQSCAVAISKLFLHVWIQSKRGLLDEPECLFLTYLLHHLDSFCPSFCSSFCIFCFVYKNISCISGYDGQCFAHCEIIMLIIIIIIIMLIIIMLSGNVITTKYD